jgi:hypothetical protein
LEVTTGSKIWIKEDSRMAIFDALAGAVAYHQCEIGNAGKNDPGSD